jgi:esterase/lipase superfamily enzyme
MRNGRERGEAKMRWSLIVSLVLCLSVTGRSPAQESDKRTDPNVARTGRVDRGNAYYRERFPDISLPLLPSNFIPSHRSDALEQLLSMDFDCDAVTDRFIGAHRCEAERRELMVKLETSLRDDLFGMRKPNSCAHCPPKIFNPSTVETFIRRETKLTGNKYAALQMLRAFTSDDSNAGAQRVVFFGTNRQIGIVESDIEFGRTRSDLLALGMLEVDRTSQSVTQVGLLRESEVAVLQPSEVLLFIHGYNSTFDQSVLTATKLAHRIKYRGKLFVYSWPSSASMSNYDYDRESILASRSPLKWFVELINQRFRPQHISIVAHSMGCQLAAEAVRDLEAIAELRNIAPIELIMASPDIDVDVFAEALPALNRIKVGLTQYVSSHDRALKTSSWKASGQRVGLFRNDNPVFFEGVDLIDVSNQSRSLLGHDVYLENELVSADIGLLIQGHLRPPHVRNTNLELVGDAATAHWRFRSD